MAVGASLPLYVVCVRTKQGPAPYRVVIVIIKCLGTILSMVALTNSIHHSIGKVIMHRHEDMPLSWLIGCVVGAANKWHHLLPRSP